METVDPSTNELRGGANNHGAAQFVQSGFYGTVNISHGTSQALPESASTIPRTVNRRLYTGRKEIADRLAAAFNADAEPEEGGIRIFVIIGLGGTGKSEICLKFTEDNSNQYWGRFWVDCTDHKTANESYKHLGQQCNFAVSEVDEIRWKLSSCGRRWLLVLDNADEPNVDLQDYIPPGGRGDVIITTRNSEYSEHATVGVDLLEGLDDELSKELLLKVAGIQSQEDAVEGETAMDVVRLLDHHTLALVQAGSYIRNGLCTLAEYPALYEQQKSEIMNYTKKQRKSTYNSVYATFEVSAKWLERESASGTEDAKSSQDALHLLHVLSFMHRSGQMELIFAEAAKYADSVLRDTSDEEASDIRLTSYHAAQLPSYAPQKWRGAAGLLQWRKACNMLKRFSLITIKTAHQGEDLSVHPLVHEWAKERQNPDSQHETWITTACILALACGGNSGYVPIYDTIYSHVRASIAQDIQEHIWKMHKHAAWRVVHQFGWVFHRNYEDHTVAMLHQVMQNLLEKEGKDSRMLVATKNLLALSKLRIGESSEAVKSLEDIVQVHKSTLDEAHPDLLTSQHELGRAYRANGQILEAVEVLEHVVQVEKSLGEAHLDRLATQHGLAMAYRENGQIKEAVATLEHVVQFQKSLDEAHPDRLASQQVLAIAYIDDGQGQRAIPILEQVVRNSELKFGADHPTAELYRKSLEYARRRIRSQIQS